MFSGRFSLLFVARLVPSVQGHGQVHDLPAENTDVLRIIDARTPKIDTSTPPTPNEIGRDVTVARDPGIDITRVATPPVTAITDGDEASADLETLTEGIIADTAPAANTDTTPPTTRNPPRTNTPLTEDGPVGLDPTRKKTLLAKLAPVKLTVR